MGILGPRHTDCVWGPFRSLRLAKRKGLQIRGPKRKAPRETCLKRLTPLRLVVLLVRNATRRLLAFRRLLSASLAFKVLETLASWLKRKPRFQSSRNASPPCHLQAYR